MVNSGKLGTFYGEFEYRLDEKGRVPIPPKWRRELQDGLVLFPGTGEPCLNGYPLAEWEKLSASLNLASGTLSASKMRRLKRAIFATAFNTNLDGQGRVALPVTLRKYAGIESDITVIGVNNYIEFWSKARWEAEKEASQAESWQIIESLESR